MKDLTQQSAEFFASQIGHAFATACCKHLEGDREASDAAMQRLEMLERRQELELKGKFSPKHTSH